MKNVHIIPHSHWDREWYMPFEYHRSYLVKLVDTCIELFDKDSEYKSFHMDGHTALIEDYLEIKPDNEEKIKALVKSGKLAIGPWYVLQDEFLTSAEANIRNLLVGMKIASKLGKVMPYGYFPDAFGNAGQMPQILKQAGMKGIIFGRGVSPKFSDTDKSIYSSRYSEINWMSPDGSSLPSVVFMNWYCNANEIPINADANYWNRVIKSAERFASTDELLLMNGCDHQPVQKDLSAALANARKAFPEYNFIHSDFETYMNACTSALPDDIATIKGELISQDSNGWYTLVNTSSSLIDLKVMNRKCEIALENIAEPLSVIAASFGKPYPHEQLLYSWKTLMKNHPHDSICNCSCDEVNDEIRMRYIKARQSTEAIIREDLEYLQDRIDTSAFADCKAVFAVFNTSLYNRSSLVTTDIDVRRIKVENNFKACFDQINSSLYTGEYELVDSDGNIIPCSVSNVRGEFGYTLPDDKFRQPHVAEKVTLSFEATDLSPMSYKVYGIRECQARAELKSLCEDKVLENEFIKANIHADGTLCLCDKKSGKVFDSLLCFEDCGDIGSEYTFVPANENAILSRGKQARIERVRDEEFVSEYKISVELEIPYEMDESAKEEKCVCTPLHERRGGRSQEFVTLPITSYISLEKHSKALKIKTVIDNNARDHRVRVLFPSSTGASTHKVESVFEAVERSNTHNPCRTYPSGCEHQQGFVMMSDGNCGLGIANIGIYEYETMDDTIALTLLRATSEMGDWGVFPTELSQMQRSVALEYSVMPYSDENEAIKELSSFAYPLLSAQLSKNNSHTSTKGAVSWHGSFLKPSAFKQKLDGDDIIMRWANYSDKPTTLTIDKTSFIESIYRSDVIEQDLGTLIPDENKWEIEVGPFEIITIGVRKNDSD